VKAIATRLRRLEDRITPPDYLRKPRKLLRIVVTSVGGGPRNLEEATCQRTLCPDGVLMELVDLNGGDGEDLTDECLDVFVSTSPIAVLSQRC
jgi:hypothetical protein